MSTAPMQTNTSNGASSAHDLFALTDEQILEIEPEAQDVEILGAERSDSMDPLREDLDLLAGAADGVARRGERNGEDANRGASGREQSEDDGLKAVATAANSTPNAPANTPTGNAQTNPVGAGSDVAPKWLAERMNDPQHGADARALWDGAQLARKEASAFREVFAKPEDAHAAAERARTLDEIDRAYFGAAGNVPEQTSASRAQLAARMLRDDPAAFREMVFAGLRALEEAGKQGTAAAGNTLATNAGVSARQPGIAAQNPSATSQSTPPATLQATQQSHGTQPQQHNTQSQHQHNAQLQNDAQRQQEARLTAYASFERAANEDLERTVGGAISRTLQDALPNAGKTENGAALKERLSGAIRQDVEKALQGDRSLGEQVARILSGQRLDNAARAQVVRLIGERAQQLVPGATRRVLADWTQTTLSANGALSHRDTAPPRSAAARLPLSEPSERPQSPKREQGSRTPQPRKIDYRRISDDDILNS